MYCTLYLYCLLYQWHTHGFDVLQDITNFYRLESPRTQIDTIQGHTASDRESFDMCLFDSWPSSLPIVLEYSFINHLKKCLLSQGYDIQQDIHEQNNYQNRDRGTSYEELCGRKILAIYLGRDYRAHVAEDWVALRKWEMSEVNAKDTCISSHILACSVIIKLTITN